MPFLKHFLPAQILSLAGMLGAATLPRATRACEGSWGNLSPQAAEVRQAIEKPSRQGAANALAATTHAAARALLRSVQKQADDAYFARQRNAATADGALFAFDFGATKAKPPWKPVQASITCSLPAGFGWLPAEDSTDPTPNLDALAASGLRFTSGCVSGPYGSGRSASRIARFPTTPGAIAGRAK